MPDSHSPESQHPDEGKDGRSDDQKQSNASAVSTGATVEALVRATKDRSRPLNHLLTRVDSKGRHHLRQMQLARRSRKPHLNPIRNGLIMSLKGVKVCYLLQRAQVDVRHF